RTYLKKAGLIVSPKRGVVEISDLGRSVLGENQDRIDHRFLTRFDSFQEFIKGTPKEDTGGDTTAEQTPEEVIDSAFNRLQEQLASDLLDTVKECSPYFFEKVVLR